MYPRMMYNVMAVFDPSGIRLLMSIHTSGLDCLTSASQMFLLHRGLICELAANFREIVKIMDTTVSLMPTKFVPLGVRKDRKIMCLYL
jgi:hypothetical protein